MGRKQVGVRFPEGLIQKLDAWLDDLNRDRRIPLNRSELIVGALDWAAEVRPEWERREPAARPYPMPQPTQVAKAAESTTTFGQETAPVPMQPQERFVEHDAPPPLSRPAVERRKGRR